MLFVGPDSVLVGWLDSVDVVGHDACHSMGDISGTCVANILATAIH